MTDMQSKIQRIMAEANLESLADEIHNQLARTLCEQADAIARARCEELGYTDPESHEAMKIYAAAQRTLITATLRHVHNINDLRTI